MATEINTSSPLMMFFSTLTTGACILFAHLVANYNNIHLPKNVGINTIMKVMFCHIKI